MAFIDRVSIGIVIATVHSSLLENNDCAFDSNSSYSYRYLLVHSAASQSNSNIFRESLSKYALTYLLHDTSYALLLTMTRHLDFLRRLKYLHDSLHLYLK